MLNNKKIPRFDSFPSKNEGKDDDMRIVKRDGFVYLFYKLGSEWYKTRMEKI